MDGVSESSVMTEDPAVTGEGKEAEVAIDEAGGVAEVQIGVDMAAADGDQTAVVDGEVVDAEFFAGDVVPASISGLVGSSDGSTDELQSDALQAEPDVDLHQDMEGFSGMAEPLMTFFEAFDVMKQGAVVTRAEWARNTPDGEVPRVVAFVPGACPLGIRPPGATHWHGVPLTLFHAVEGGAVRAPGFIANGSGSNRGLSADDLIAEDWLIADGVENPVLPLPTAA